MTKKCPVCLDNIQGRSDKKFCSDQCRSTFNNQHKKENEKIIQSVNKVLRKNRTILQIYNPEGMTTIRKEILEVAGFNFKYFTSIYKTKTGEQYFFVYDYGYQFLNQDKIRIVTHQKYMKKEV